MTGITRQSRYFDNTRISDYKKCPRSYMIRHVLGWTRDGNKKAAPLVFGSAWHAGMDAIYGNVEEMVRCTGTIDKTTLTDLAIQGFLAQWIEDDMPPVLSLEEQDKMSPRTPGIAHEMYFNYISHHETMLRQCRVVAIEQPIAVPMPGLDDVWYIGKLDKVIEWNGQEVILEHKSTTAYAIQGSFQRDYLASWYTAPQVKGYEFAGSIYYPKLQGVWVDASLVHKKVHDAFKIIPVNHSWPLLKEWITDTKEWIVRIIADEELFKKTGRLPAGNFPRNEDSCFGKYGVCPFLDICRTVSDPSSLEEVPDGYVLDKWEPFETLKLDKLINK